MLRHVMVRAMDVSLLTLTDSVTCSVSYRYARPELSPEKNAQIYGRDSSLAGLGGDFVIEATAESSGPHPGPEAVANSWGQTLATGALPNWTRPGLEALKKTLDHRCLFRDVEWFAARPNTVENLALFAAEFLTARPPTAGAPVCWRSVRVRESRELVALYDFPSRTLALEVCRSFPIQWKTAAGWGGGQWRVALVIARPLDEETGLLAPRAGLNEEMRAALRPAMSELHSTADRGVLARRVALGLRQIPGFQRVEIWTRPRQAESFIFSESDFLPR